MQSHPTYPADALARARAEAQTVLARSASFRGMNANEQLAMYRSLVAASLSRSQPRPGAAAGAMSRGALARGLDDAPLPAPPTMGGLTRQDVANTRLDNLAAQGADFINEIDFPQFVKDLLKGVFDANLQVTIKQMETYQKLLKTAMESLAKFVSKIDDAAAFAHLVENRPDEFSLDFDDTDKDEQGRARAVLTDKEGNRLDLGDNEVRARIMDAKIAMAKEHRAMLRETILMGITRLVVEKGVVEASVLFDVHATENIVRQGKSGNELERTSATEDTPGWFSSIFGGGDSTTRQQRQAQITVSSVKAVSDSRLAAQIKGNVKIQFKSDYFKLDNFAALYQTGDGGAPLGQIPGSSAVIGRGAPGFAPGAVSGAVPGVAPGMAPGVAPGVAPGMAPGMVGG